MSNLVYGNCYIKIAKNNVLASKKFVTLEDLRFIPCILVASRQQENNEQDFYQGRSIYKMDGKTRCSG